MKMKKFFSHRSKKKKAPSAVDAKVLDEISEINTLDDKRKPSQSQHKKKGRKGKQANAGEKNFKSESKLNGHTNGNSAAIASNGVVLRRHLPTVNSDENSHLRSPIRLGHGEDDPRLPGSESSSRTASSASTSSHGRWSTRRPWSLVESPFGGQTLEEFTESRGEIPRREERDPSSRHNVTAPAISTLPRGSDPSLIDSSVGERRPRTMAMDFSIFRFFRRNSTSNKSPDAESGSLSSFGTNSSGRSSFRMKNLKTRKDKKSKRRSEDGKSGKSSHSSSLSSYSDQERCSRSASAIQEEETSGSTIKAFSSCDKIDEEKTPIHQPLSKYDSYSTQDSCSLRSCTMTGSVNSECSHCNRLRNSQAYRPSSGDHLSIIDTDPQPVTTITRTRAPSQVRPYSTPCSTVSFASTSTYETAGSRDLYASSNNSTSDTSTIGASAIFGGSTSNLSRRPLVSSASAQTLPRNLDYRNPLHKLTKTPVHSSLPQLNSPEMLQVASRRNESLTQTDNTSRPRSATTFALGKPDNPMVESPIKRAIGYPGVVLRRQQKNRTKKFGGKSASADLLTGERRGKQVLSLNMEDLPTYGEMRGDELRWRSASLFTKPGQKSSSNIPPAELAGRARLRAALIYQRYSSHCTSMDDVRMSIVSQQNFKDMFNLDDDEFLDMYLATGDSAPPSDANRNSASQEPSSKRVKTLRKSVASFANLISPGKPSRHKIQRSSSFKESSTPAFKPYRPPGSQTEQGSGSTPGRRGNSANSKNRRSRLWCETFDHSGLDEVELKRQEAIHELYQGECDLVQDLRLAKQTYRDSMVTLKMLTEEEVTRIFGKLECLLPLHEDLLAHLERGRSEDGRTEAIGHVFIDWFPTLSPYEEYCSNQADAKETLDAVIGREARVRDFLQRCIASPFSRKLDLWSYLDLPRSKLVKYPLLLKNILKSTPAGHPDQENLEKALLIINDIIARVDDLTGERQSRFFQSKLEYLDEKQRSPQVAASRFLLCSGQLKSNRGTKLHVFLFDLSLVLTRNATRGGKLTYQVYRQPLPVENLVIDGDEGGKLSGSFRGSILSSDKAKHSFRVRCEEMNVSHTLIATDEHDRKQWINAIQDAIAKCKKTKRASAASDASSSSSRSSLRHFGAQSKSQEENVKRSSSTKSDDGGSRRRSLTNVVSRSNSKGKKDYSLSSSGKKKITAESPLSRRRSNTVATGKRKEDEAPVEQEEAIVVKMRQTDTIKKNNPCRRSRSLTSSPISLLSSFPRKSSKNGSASNLSRSESYSLKPPSGKNQNIIRTTSDSRARGKVSTIHETKSSPDLSATSRANHSKGSNFIGTDLNEVENRLGGCPEEERDTPSPIFPLNLALVPDLQHLLPTLLIDSPEHPAASNTSRNFPIVEEESISPLYKPITATSPLRTSSSAPAMSFSCTPVVQPTISWAPRSDNATTPYNDVISITCDVTASCKPDEPVVSSVMSVVLDQVCSSDSDQVKSSSGTVTVVCDDGTPWRGDDLEVTV